MIPPTRAAPGRSSSSGAASALLVTAGLIPEEGGIQAYAKLVWDALEGNGPRSLISLGPAGAADCAAAPSLITWSKWGLASRVLFRKWPADVGIFTHVELLKLLPLMTRSPSCLVAFLNGVEAWQPLGWFTRRALRRVGRFLSISQYTWERFSTANPEFAGRSHAVLYLGIGNPTVQEVLPPEQPPTALILGRMALGEDYKGHKQLIAAWQRILARVPGARLWIAGSGNLRPELEALTQRSGLGDAVQFLGRVSEEAKQDLLRRARCFVMPSRGEGFGLVYLEAMRLGRPCLVGNRDAGREVVNPPEAGLAVDPDDPAALVEAVTRLLTPGPQWDAWSAAARRRYESRFTAAHFQRRFLDELNALATQAQG
jgi:phosphatidylinositol alpha-1,6-mannosyltransferase